MQTTRTKKGLQYADFVEFLERQGMRASRMTAALADFHGNVSRLIGINAIWCSQASLSDLFHEVFNAETDSRSPLMLSIDVDILSADELAEELNGDLPSLGQWVTHREFGALECTARVVEKVAGRNVLVYQFEKGFSRG